jgi:hypothetical protein
MDPKGSYSGYADSKLFKYNFTAAVKCGTIEFRQLRSTFNPSEVSITFVTTLFWKALTHNKALWDSSEKTVDRLFEILEVDRTDLAVEARGLQPVEGKNSRF